MPPTPHPKTPRPLTIVVCESVPTSESGKATRLPFCCVAEDHAREIFEIHLVADAGVRRNNFEILKSFLSPAQKSVALDIALHFQAGVEGERVCRAEFVHLHGMVNYQLGGEQGIDFLRVAAEIADRVAHRGEINHGGNAGEILQQHARGHERNFFFGGAGCAGGVPARKGANVIRMNEAIVFVAQEIFEQHFQREREARNVADSGARERIQAINFK